MTDENGSEFLDGLFEDGAGEELPEVPFEAGDREYVQITSTSGPQQIVMLDTVDGDFTIANVVAASGLAIQGTAEFQVDGQWADNDQATLASGQVLTIVGVVKGG